MLAPVPATAYDLKFRLLGFPVRVHPMFWLVGLLLGSSTNRLDLIAMWIVCLFVSILVHELGHALAVRRCGWPCEIVLYHFGGQAIFSPSWGYTRNRAIAIAFAGPAAGFVLYGLIKLIEIALVRAAPNNPWLLQQFTGDKVSPLEFALIQLEWINLFWGLVNLLPVSPLDGGKICSELLSARNSYRGAMRTSQVGMLVAGAAAAWFLSQQQIFAALLFASLCIENYRNYEQFRRGPW